MGDKLSPGILVMREHTAAVGFALSDLAHNSEPSDVARQQGGRARACREPGAP
jgi:hypothetical protein